MIKEIIQYFKKDIIKEEPSLGEIGWESSNLFTSKDFPKYNPDDLLGRKGPAIYKKMLEDEQVKAAIHFKINAVLSRGYFFDVRKDDETGEPDTEHEKMADFFDAMIKNIKGSFSDNLSCILSGLYNGFSIDEKIYGLFEWDGKEYWGLEDIKLRPFDSFDGGFVTDEHGNILKLIQMQGSTETEIPFEKVIHFVHQPAVDAHYGESDLRACYRAYWSKDVAIKFQNIYLERLAGGFAWAQVTEGKLTTSEKTNLESILKNISVMTGVIMPAKVDMKMQQPNRTDAYDKAIAQHDKAIAKSILVPNLLGLSEQGQTGSYAQSQTQLDAFFWILDHIAKSLSQVLNEQVFKEQALWNFGTDDFPWFTFEALTDDMKLEFAKAWTELVKGGSVTKSDADEAHIRRMINMPEKSEDAEEEPLPGFPPTLPTEIPNNEPFLQGLPDLRQAFVKKELADRPWLKRINFTRIDNTFNTIEGGMIDDVAVILAKIRTSLEYQINKITGERSMGSVGVKEYEVIKIPASMLSSIRREVRTYLKQTWEDSVDAAKKELPRKAFKRIGPGMDRGQADKFLSSKAMKITGVLEQRILDVVLQTLENGIKYDKTLTQIINILDDEIGEFLPEVDSIGRPVNRPARLELIARTNIADAVNQARMQVFTDPDLKGFIKAFEYSAILDSRTTPICEHLNGKILKDFAEHAPPNHYQCRSILVAVTEVDDWGGKQSPSPRLNPHKGFG